MKLENLVPPLELCKQIPEGEFAGSALVWVYFHSGWQNTMEWDVFERSGEPRYPHCPAPTLAEILEVLGAATCYHLGETWTVALCNDSLDNGVKDATPATAALRLWLKVEGIE